MGYVWPPLQIAARLGLHSWVEHLIVRGESLEDGEDFPSALSAASPDVDMLTLLLTNGASPNIEYEGEMPALLLWLLKNPEYEIVKLFLDHGANLTVLDSDKWTALHCFALSGKDPRVLDLLLPGGPDNDGLDVDATDKNGETALHILLRRRDLEPSLLRAFLDHGASPNIDDIDSEQPLYEASINGDIQVMHVLLPRVKDINDKTNYGRTALHLAAWKGEKDCVQLFLDYKADPNIVDEHERTPLFFACLGKSEQTVGLLLQVLRQNDYPVDKINQATKRGRTPLRQAASRGFVDAVRDLLALIQASEDSKAKAMIDRCDVFKGRSALHCAALWGEPECVRLLLDSGAEITLEDKGGKTALELAREQWALSGRTSFEETICHLIDKDPEAAIADAELLATAAANGSKRTLEKLHSFQADLDRPDQYGWTPLMLAKQFRHAAAETFLKQQATWASTRPSRWIDPPANVTISDDGCTVISRGLRLACVSANKPVPAGLSEYYFEVTQKAMQGVEQSEYPSLAIGFCTSTASAINFPGWKPTTRAPMVRSWGYHGDDGILGDSLGPLQKDLARRYKPGDTVGCGV